MTSYWGMGIGGLFLAAGIGTLFLDRNRAIEAEEVKKALDPDNFKKFRLAEVKKVTHNTSLFRFVFDDPEQVLGLDVASCIVVRAPIGEDGKMVVRPYTPVTPIDQKGYFDLVIKYYDKGAMSKHIHSLKPGDYLEVKGPIPKIKYEKNMKKRIGMIAGGTGITPMLQVVREILRNPDDKTEIDLVFANDTEDDIILREEFDQLAQKYPNFRVYYVVLKPSEEWNQGKGFVNEEIIREHIPPPSEDHLVMVCGPPGMMKAISGEKAKDKSQGELEGLLKKLGYTKEMVFKF